MTADQAEVANLRGALVEARQVIVTACGTSAPYVRTALKRIDDALAGVGVVSVIVAGDAALAGVVVTYSEAPDGIAIVTDNRGGTWTRAQNVADLVTSARADVRRSVRHMDAGKETVCQAEAPEDGSDLMFTDKPDEVSCTACLSIMADKKFENEAPLLCPVETVRGRCGGVVEPTALRIWECSACSNWFSDRDVLTLASGRTEL